MRKEAPMSRFMEGIFVIGCALVGLGMGAPEGTGIQNGVKYSVRLIANVENDLTTNVDRLQTNLTNVPEQVLRGLCPSNGRR